MSNRSIGLSDALHEYLLEAGMREPPVLKRLREETRQHPMSNMQIAPEQGQFMHLLVKLIGAEQTLEVGVFTGYSALSVAMALPEGGRVVGCDVEPDYTTVAERFFEEAGLRDRLDLRIGPATQTLDHLLEEEKAAETFDLAFIDADKTQYDAYYERALRLLRPGGVVLLDNVFRGGEITEPDSQDEGTRALQQLNTKICSDERVDLSMLPLADGLTLACKR